MNFLHFHVSTDYILSMPYFYGLGETTSTRLCVLPSRGIVVEVSPVRSLPADYQFLLQDLGFNLVPSTRFFLFSPHITLRLISSLRCSSSNFTIFQQFSFFVASLHHVYLQVSLQAYLLIPLYSPQLRLGVLRVYLII